MIFEHPSFLNGTLIVLETDGAKESMIVENLHPGTVYTFRVIAYNEEGNSSNQTTGYQETTLEESMFSVYSRYVHTCTCQYMHGVTSQTPSILMVVHYA